MAQGDKGDKPGDGERGGGERGGGERGGKKKPVARASTVPGSGKPKRPTPPSKAARSPLGPQAQAAVKAVEPAPTPTPAEARKPQGKKPAATPTSRPTPAPTPRPTPAPAAADTPEPTPAPRRTPPQPTAQQRAVRPSIPPLDVAPADLDDDDDLVVAEPVEDEAGDEAPDAEPDGEAWGDEFWGGEAAPPPPDDAGPGLDTRREIPYTRRAITEEVRELERRVKARLTPAFPIEHRRRLPLEPVWRRLRDLAMRNRSDVVDELGRDPMVAARVQPLLDFLYDRYFRVDVVGAEHLPASGRALLVANHSGTLPYDGAMLMQAVRRVTGGRRELRPLVEDFVFHFPYLGTFINRIGGVRACQENAERLLADDQLVAVFPEGIKGIGKLYRERYRLQRFGRGGFVKLALRTGAPIIPVAIVGAEEIHPMVAKITWLARSLGAPYLPVTPTFPALGPLGLVPIPTKWTIRIGPPMDAAARHGAEAAGDRILVGKLAEQVRSNVQEMLDDILSRRKSVLFG